MEDNLSITPHIPDSTYRLQLNGGFRFTDAARIVHYLHTLGISDIYCSPYLRAKQGSTHGYDIIDHTSINDELGDMQDYDGLISELKRHGMGQILDIVPNHMCVASNDNALWMDVLENGTSSIYARYFDINWYPVNMDLTHRVLIPELGDQYGNILENGELQLSFEEGAFFVWYYDHKYPIRPQTYINILQYELDNLRDSLGEEHPQFTELLSILTAIKNLPAYLETDVELVKERAREKEIIKRRLNTLHNESVELRAFIDNNVKTFNGVKGDSGSFDLLDTLLRSQIYRLAYWKVAMEEINYRRFFDINELGAIRMEDDTVFNHTHRLIAGLIREGKVNGLRIDHPDGLFSPADYFYSLQRLCYIQGRLAEGVKDNEGVENLLNAEFDAIMLSNPEYKPFYIVGEKIFAKNEIMPDDWMIFSSTGYAFLNNLNGLFVNGKNKKHLDNIYSKFIDHRFDYEKLVYDKKKLVMKVSLASEINMLGYYLKKISENNRHTRDFTLNSLINVIVEVISNFPVYRTYARAWQVNSYDKTYIEFAVSNAKEMNPSINASTFDFLKDVLLLNLPDGTSDAAREQWIGFVMKFQQITGPVMAKGVEDTVFYIYNRLVSLNEVGGHPDTFGVTVEDFHSKNINRLRYQPHALITTATHDTKRGEDVRTRINVLSELPDEWERLVFRLKKLNESKRLTVGNKTAPAPNDEYLLYQTLIGATPTGLTPELVQTYDLSDFKARISNYMIKAIREAKVNSSWINPNDEYEKAIVSFIYSLLVYKNNKKFFELFLPFQNMVSAYGMYNSLSQVLLKITSPGVPDFYQGTELWDYSLVDPDNRRAVDYETRIAMLSTLQKKEREVGIIELNKELLADMKNGMIKMFLTYKVLNYRKANKRLFDVGDYVPLATTGKNANNVCAFGRSLGNDYMVVVAPRLVTDIFDIDTPLSYIKKSWRETYILLPIKKEMTFKNILTNQTIKAQKHGRVYRIPFYNLTNNFPVAFLTRFD
ncbi:MAG: malto-oligosyltrehalose synthase [Candidatus Magnetobacterium sp. LHC-1]|uniref:Malto-oligosyltrehalose synthase n=1 Tax=Candidatus Magnetobacterium casense TaxID=1455061 RepID=A0ABS6RY03_9BACT|nr:malto-oligosyltrehalose synthase [Candidatus Magnetobacterium casensis]MBF0608965.1 malto-oligosyltrehalose synthase [Nitrospirota bacterium]MBV6341519.1 malto-oligosyltrehalose synthase [Candidatus Magnetobacterium casensis]